MDLHAHTHTFVEATFLFSDRDATAHEKAAGLSRLTKDVILFLRISRVYDSEMTG